MKLLVLFISIVGMAPYVVAHGNDKCAEELTPGDRGSIEISPSGRSTPNRVELDRQAAHDVAEVAAKLGYFVPPHKMIYAPSRDLSAMVTVGGHATPTWLDGRSIIEQAAKLSGVMEFVVGGCPTCRSFYRDTTSFYQQVSIVMHVAGHNDYSKASYLAGRRSSDSVAAKLQLSHLMSDLYSRYDKNEVSLYYQFLNTLLPLQDFSRGTYTHPDELRNSAQGMDDLARVTMPRKELGEDSPYPPRRWPEVPTPSALQAYVSNMPANSPEWKKEMARLFEIANNDYPSNVQDKIGNEGWASFSQYLIAKHLDGYNSDAQLMAYADLMGGVRGKGNDFSNPYWLGHQCWKNLYEKFRRKPEIAGLADELEKDQEFVKYAHSIIATADDYSFIRMALDEDWIRANEYYLKREATQEELAAKGIQLPPGSDQKFEVVLSISAQRIIDAIARGVGDKRRHFPRLFLDNMNHKGEEVLYTHEIFEDMPLERFGTAQSLFLLAHMYEKPVSLDTVASTLWTKGEEGKKDTTDYPESLADLDPWEIQRREQEKRAQAPSTYPIRITVKPGGRVIVYTLPNKSLNTAEGQESNESTNSDGEPFQITLHKELTEQLQAAVDFYKEDLALTASDDLYTMLADQVEDQRVKDWISKVSSEWSNGVADTLSMPKDQAIRHASTAPAAILAYQAMLRERIPLAMQKMAAGKLPYKVGKNGVQLRALPIVPEIQFDKKIMNITRRFKPLGPIDGRYDQGVIPDVSWDDASDLGQGPAMPGDIKPIPPQEEGEGSGEGQEGEEEEESEADEGDPSEDKPEDVPADGANDPSVVEIPMDAWEEFRNSHFELPNPRKVVGNMQVTNTERAGVRTKEGEPVVWDQTIDAALGWAVTDSSVLRAVPGESPVERVARIRGTIIEGLRRMPEEEYRIRSYQETLEPEFKAAVVFVLDLSGSMMGEPLLKSKEFIYSVVSFLKSKYPDVEVRFIGYDTVARELSEDKIFKTQLGGATDDSVGYILANEIFDEYDASTTNFYMYGTGDGGGGDVPRTVEELEKLYNRVQHMGFVENQLGWAASPQILEAIKGLSEKYGWFDYAELNGESNSILKALTEFFGKHKNSERGRD